MRVSRLRAAVYTNPDTVFVFYLMLTITITGLYKYLPQQVDMLTQRMVYYIFGHEADKALHTQRLMAGVVGMNATREL